MSVNKLGKSRKGLEKFIKNDVDDFWNDCMNLEPKEKIVPYAKLNTNENVEQYITCILIIYLFLIS